MNSMTTLRGLVCALLALHAAASEACYAPPARQLIPPEEQLVTATDVAVGQVISATPMGDYLVEYRFLTLEQLAGPGQKVFTVMGGPAGFNNKDSTFNNHSDFTFWARGGGRTKNGADCVIRPGFVLGNSYVLILDSPPTRRSYEKIEMVDGRLNADDRWLAYVRQMLIGRGAGGVPQDYDRVGRFIYGFHRTVTRDDLDRKALAAQHAPDALLLRAGRLADEFDRIVDNALRVSDAQLDATLREAGELRTALQAWRDGATPKTSQGE
jgi:hypothetical protein